MAFRRPVGKGKREFNGDMRAVVVAMVLASASSAAFGQTCEREAFEAVVDQASMTLVTLNQKNTPEFQASLRKLKERRGWSQEQFLKEGAPFVQDPTIVAFDETSQQLLIKINSQNTETADCKLLAELRAAMATLVETQNAKWAYMFDKISRELARSP